MALQSSFQRSTVATTTYLVRRWVGSATGLPGLVSMTFQADASERLGRVTLRSRLHGAG